MIIKSQNWGFTLIELLVVISIIGILSTLLIANVAGVRERARDVQRKSDISQIQKALEMYKADQSPPEYPSSITTLSSKYIKNVPVDPNASPWPSYGSLYTRDPNDKLTYIIKACLENKSDPQKDIDQNSCSSSCKDPNDDRETDDGGVCYTRTEP